MNSNDTGRLGSLNEYGERINIIPAEVRGYFRKHRNWTQALLIMIFLVIPWTKWGGHQTILFDVPERKFALFGLVFYAHDTPLIFFLVFGAAITLAFITSVWGRVWCGWACPQTVFLDGVYRKIEQLIEGNYLARRQLRDGPMTFDKMRKTISKWALFTLVSSIIAHSFAAYFIGAEKLFKMSLGSPAENWNYFLIVSIITGILLFNFGWFREQFCTIMCPYGRIQSVLIGKKSLTVMYDVERGEPRKGQPLATGQRQGDCVNCLRCVQVCPTGIDIRNGLQMECIACTACIDACDEIMEKVKKPKGLIKYNTLDGSKITLKNPQSIIYMGLIVACIVGLIYTVSTRSSTDWTLLRGGTEAPYQLLNDETGTEVIVNHYRIHLKNQSGDETEYTIALDKLLANVADEKMRATLVSPLNPIKVKAGDSFTWHFFVKFHRDLIKGTGKYTSKILIQSSDAMNPFNSEKELILLGPAQ